MIGHGIGLGSVVGRRRLDLWYRGSHQLPGACHIAALDAQQHALGIDVADLDPSSTVNGGVQATTPLILLKGAEILTLV